MPPTTSARPGGLLAQAAPQPSGDAAARGGVGAARAPAIRLGSVAVGVVLTVLGALAEVLASQFQVGGEPFVTGSAAILEVAILAQCLVALANGALRRIRPGWMFTPAERVVVYGMVAAGGAFSAYDCMQFVIPTILYPFHYAASDASLLRVQQYLPSWLAPRSPAVVEPYYLGRTSFFRPLFLQAWLGPLIVWLLFAGCLALIMVCVSILVRRQWIENEHLTFPSLHLPLAMVRDTRGGFGLAGRLAVIGLAAPLALGGLRLAHGVWPSVPSPTLSTDLAAGFTSAPWNGLQPFPATIRPLDIGICYFVPLDVGLSAWLFFLLLKLLQVPGTAYGWRDWGWSFDSFPHWRQQAIGAWIALFAVLLWSGRRPILGALRAGFSSAQSADAGRAERWAARGLTIGLVALLVANWWAGMTPWVALLFLALFVMLQVIMTRIRAQIGPPVLEVFMVEPANMMLTLVGPAAIRPASLTLMAFYYWFTQNNRAQPMAHHLDTFRLARETRAGTFSIVATLILAGCVGAATCLLAFLVLGYHYGQVNFPGGALRNFAAQSAYGQLPGLYDSPRGPNVAALPGMAVGGGVVVTLAMLQRAIVGFPLSPVGYALALSGALLYNWPAFVIVWFIKGGILRYGGLKLYRQIMPVFQGLILGDILAQFFTGLTSWALTATR